MQRLVAFVPTLVTALILSLSPLAATAQVQIQESWVRVHVTGRVKQPGVYTLPRGARGVDAIQAAGGITPGAVLEELNLASVLEDGARLDVPSTAAPAKPMAVAPPPRRRAARSASRPASKAVIALNQASLEQLDSLPGIGRSLAEEILRYRQQKGAFRSLDELKEVPGIGERRFERLAPLLKL